MKRIWVVVCLVLFLLGCESADEDDALRHAENRALEAEEKADELADQLTAVSEHLTRIEEKLDGNVPVVVEEEPEIEEGVVVETNITEELENKSEQQLTTTISSIPPAPLGNDYEEDEPLTDEIQAILDRADEIVTSYSFFYALPPADYSSSNVYIKGNNMKIRLMDTKYIGNENYIDTIYVDFYQKTAVGTCEESPIQYCANRSKQTVLEFDDYNLKTPYQWLKEITSARQSANVIIWDRNADVLKHTSGDTKYTYWIDEFSGIPVKIIIRDSNTPDDIYEFRYLSVNHLDKDDVVPKVGY